MSDVVSKIWLQHVLEPTMPRFRLSARIPLGTSALGHVQVIEWLDEVSLKLVEHGPFVRAEEG